MIDCGHGSDNFSKGCGQCWFKRGLEETDPETRIKFITMALNTLSVSIEHVRKELNKPQENAHDNRRLV